MGRAPCCDKVGLKRGSWTVEEDRILISFIEKYGHSNWRALPKQAGLLRCGKSCRLRWTNYLRPDIKRGNFTKEEEDYIIQLHELMGNRWSAIAARLSGRTDNEIKNVWHTHLKKRINKQNRTPNSNASKMCIDKTCDQTPHISQQSEFSDDLSSLTDVTSVDGSTPSTLVTSCSNMNGEKYDVTEFELLDELPIDDATFWSSERFVCDGTSIDLEFQDNIEDKKILDVSSQDFPSVYGENGPDLEGDNLDFWLDIFVKADGALELPKF